MRRYLLTALMLTAGISHITAAPAYQETFEDASGTFASVGWQVLGMQDGELKDLSQLSVAVGVTNTGYGFYAPKTTPPSGAIPNSPALVFTQEMMGLAIADLVALEVKWIGDNVDATLRVAVEIDGDWLVSNDLFEDTRTNPGAEASILTARFAPQNADLPENWRTLNHTTPGGTMPPQVGEILATPLTGMITKVGVLVEAGTTPENAGDHIRLGSFSVETTAEKDDRPNVLFITIDDLNDVPTFMGRYPDAQTPNMDALAASGTAFLNAHASYPLCGPSRASLLTGLRPTTLGFQNHMTNNELLTRANALNAPLMDAYFRQNGYRVYSAGKIYHAGPPPAGTDGQGGSASFGATQGLHYSSPGTGTDWGVPSYGTADANFADHTNAQFAIARLQESHDAPFLLMVGFVQPHVPWYAPQTYFDLYPNKNALTLPSYLPTDLDDVPAESVALSLGSPYPRTEWAIANDERANIMQAYLACVSFTDHYLGQVLAALANSPYADNTIIVLLSDNGYHLGEKNTYQKQTLWERSSHVPLIMAGPGIVPGQRCEKIVSLLDVYPTLLELCGLQENPMLEGECLLPLLENAEVDWDHPAVTSFLGNNHAVQTSRYRYLLWNDGSEELYDHSTDPNEHDNLGNDPAYTSIKAELRKLLPTNLTSPAFPLLLQPNNENPSACLQRLLNNGDFQIYGESIQDTTTTVEGFRLETAIASNQITVQLVPGGPFGIWRAEQFSSRELRDLSLSGSSGQPPEQPIPNLLRYALDPSNPRGTPSTASDLQFEIIDEGAVRMPQIQFQRSPLHNDIDLHVELSAELSPESWILCASSIAGGNTMAFHGSLTWELGLDPVDVQFRGPPVSTNQEAMFLRVRAELHDPAFP